MATVHAGRTPEGEDGAMATGDPTERDPVGFWRTELAALRANGADDRTTVSMSVDDLEAIIRAGPRLTADEVHALELTADLANTMRRIIGTGGDCWEHDWNEVARIIHDLQSRIAAQLASRGEQVYVRPLGGWIRHTSTAPAP